MLVFCRCFYIRLASGEDSARAVPYRRHSDCSPLGRKPVGNDVACQTQLKMLPEARYVVITLPCSLEHGNIRSRVSRERDPLPKPAIGPRWVICQVDVFVVLRNQFAGSLYRISG